jgi:hypothetical protein
MDANIEYLLQYYNISNDIIESLNNKNINIEFYIQCLLNNENSFKNKLKYDFHKEIINILEKNNYNEFYLKCDNNNILFSKNKNTNLFYLKNKNINLIHSLNIYFLNQTNLKWNKSYNNYNYEKILRISFLGDKNIVDYISNKINIPLYGISNDINDPKYIESFNNNQLLPIQKSWFFHSQYSLIYNNYFSYFDILFHSLLTLTIPIFIGDYNFIKNVLNEIIEFGFDINGIIILKDLEEFIYFTNNIKWDDYNDKTEIMIKNKLWMQEFIDNFINNIKNDINNNLILDENIFISKKIIELVYPEESFILNMIIDLKSNNLNYNYDLVNTVRIIKFIEKIKNLEKINTSTIYFNNVIQKNTLFKNDIYCYLGTTGVYDETNKSFNCLCSCLEPISLSGCDSLYNELYLYNDIMCSANYNKDLNLLSPGWIMSWSPHGIPNLDINEIKNNKNFSISFLFSLRGNSEVNSTLKNSEYTYNDREFFIKNSKDITIPKKIYISNWNKDLPKQYPEFPLIPDGKECLYNSMFNISLENSKIHNYYAEKILDCFLTLTVPIYIGCPNIGDYYDKRGIIFANSGEDMISICNTLSNEKYYSLEEYYMNNYKLSKFWLKYHNYQNLTEDYLIFLENFYN